MEKIEIINHLLEELESGKTEEEVKDEFIKEFGEEEYLSLMGEYKSYSLPVEKEQKNPLVYLAEENGALRALKKNILLELSYEDASKEHVRWATERLLQVKKHYAKIQNVLFPFLKGELKEEQTALFSEEEKVVSLLSNYLLSGDTEILYDALFQLEKNIEKENHLLLPYLEENYSLEEMMPFFDDFKRIGGCLISIEAWMN